MIRMLRRDFLHHDEPMPAACHAIASAKAGAVRDRLEIDGRNGRRDALSVTEIVGQAHRLPSV